MKTSKTAFLTVVLFSACGQVNEVEAINPAAESASITPVETIQEGVEMNSENSNALGHSFPDIEGGELALSDFEGRPVLVVNTASMCGFTKQYAGLQTIHERYSEQGFAVIGIPSQDFGGQEYDSAEETKNFCEVNFGISFPMSTKQIVKGANAHPFYLDAIEALGESAEPKWNFHKILVDRNGAYVKAYPSDIAPEDPALLADIEALL